MAAVRARKRRWVLGAAVTAGVVALAGGGAWIMLRNNGNVAAEKSLAVIPFESVGVSMSRWKRNSSSVRDSLARRDRDSRARVRAALSQLMGCSGSEAVATWRQRPRVSKCDSGGAQHGLEAGGKPPPVLELVA